MAKDVSIAVAESNVNRHNDPLSTNILQLDDDSLLHILEFLPIKDKLSLFSAHERFISILQTYAKASLKEVNEDDLYHLKPLEIHSVFKNLGERLESLSLTVNFEKYLYPTGLDLVKLYCPNLKRLSLFGNLNESGESFECFRNLLLNKPNLRTLRLERLRLKDAYLNSLIVCDNQLPHLEHLSLVDCSEFHGLSLKNFTCLKKLRLENIKGLNYSVLRETLAAMPNLYALSYLAIDSYDMSQKFVGVINGLHFYNKKIEILELNMPNVNSVRVSKMPNLKHFAYAVRDFNWLTTMKLSELLEHKNNMLESLYIKSFWNYQSQIEEQCQLISQFTKLKKLHLPTKHMYQHYDININDDSLRHLCALQNLTEFKACGANSFTKDGLINLVRSCKKLQWLNIQNSLIDNAFAEDLTSVVKEQGQRPNGRITFLVFGSQMKELNLPAVYKSKEMKQYVEFIFKELPTLEAYDNLFDSFEHDSSLITMPFFSNN